MKKVILAASVLLTIIFVLIFYYFSKDIKLNDKSILFSRVPESAALIVEFNNDESLFELYDSSDLVSTLLTEQTIREFSFLKAHILTNQKLKDHWKGKSMLASMHKVKADKLGILYLGLCDEENFGKPEETFADLLKSGNSISQHNFGKIVVYEISMHATGQRLCFAFSDEVMLVSFTPFLVEEGLREYSEGKSFANQPDFKRLNDLKAKQNIATVYINYKMLPEFMEAFVNPEFNERFNMISGFSGPSVLDVNYKSDSWMLSGQTVSDPTKLLSVFDHQNPQAITLPNYFSSKTALFYNFGISNFKLFSTNMSVWLKSKKEFFREAEFKRIEAKYKIDLEEKLAEIVGNELALVIGDHRTIAKENDQMAFIRLKNIEKANQLFNDVQEFEINLGRIPTAESYKDFTIRPNFIRNMMLLCGGVFFKKYESNYYVIIEDRLMLAKSKEILKSYIDDYISLQILKENAGYKNFISSVGDQSNLYFYSSVDRSSTFLMQSLLPDMAEQFSKNKGSKNYYGCSYQLSFQGSSYFTTIYLPLIKKSEENSNLVWKLQLGSAISSSPYIVKNPDNNEKEIIIQDDANTLYLIDNAGKIIWKVPISSKIISQIYQVDYYKNGKLQFLFNTDQQLYLLDHAGKMMINYPKRLSTKATCGLSLFDYDNNKNYRIFIACDNRSIFGYDISGRPLDGWNPKQNVGILNHPVQHVSVKGKDYIFANNENGDFYLFNRKGELLSKYVDPENTSYFNPFIFDSNPDPSKSRFINTDRTGTIKSVFPDGRRLYKHVGNWSPDHFFSYANLTGDSLKEYIFLDKNQLFVYRDDTTIAFNYEFKSNIETPPQLFQDSAGKYILGVSSVQTNLLFLFDEEGRLKNGFPVQGSTPFRIDDLRTRGKKLLITGSNDGYLYVYELNTIQ